ncbi:E3 ubiquitin protein ligase RIE1-like [Wolffia australiana]
MSTMAEDQSEPLIRRGGGVSRNRIAAVIDRAVGRRGASAMVRETAASQIEERRIQWGYSRPVVALDIVWNLAFALTAMSTLASTVAERPNVPIRIWIAGYALQSVIHVTLVFVEFRRRRRRRSVEDGLSDVTDSEGNDSDEDDLGVDPGTRNGGRSARMAKRCESLNTVLSFLWWTVGFYWVVSGGETLIQKAPTLYWLVVVFLAVDVFFAILCVALACVIGVALCCCLPFIIAILYALAGQEGASDADINILPNYRFVQFCSDESKEPAEAGRMVPVDGDEETNGQLILQEDAECCICLTAYEDGAELHALPCNHHFHSSCITRWLRINATCPLCKYNILKGNE